MANIDLEGIRKLVENMPIPYAKMSGMYLDTLEERHAKVVMPLDDLHKNHVGVAYAGSMFVLAEVYTAIIIYATYGMDKYIPIAAKDEITYIKPTKKDLVIDMSISEEKAAEMIKPIEERGRGRGGQSSRGPCGEPEVFRGACGPGGFSREKAQTGTEKIGVVFLTASAAGIKIKIPK